MTRGIRSKDVGEEAKQQGQKSWSSLELMNGLVEIDCQCHLIMNYAKLSQHAC